nr:hypothetical protein [uncultured Alistipes sp.]
METIPNFLQKQDFLQENLFRDADEQSAEQAVGQPAVAASYDPGELGRIVRTIRQAVDPERVVLFGSLAGAMPFSEMAAYVRPAGRYPDASHDGMARPARLPQI